MIAKLIHWSVTNPLIVILFTLALAGAGGYAFSRVNIEAYPDPAPAIVEVIAQYAGRSAEEMERQVTIPLEVALSGMPGLKYIRSKSLFGLSYINTQFEYGFDYKSARQEVINRIGMADLPPDVNPQISPRSPIGEILRYAVVGPKDAHGNRIYSLADLRSIQEWTFEREFRRIPGIADVVSFGGLVKRYEIQPDPDRMKRYGITLEQLQKAIADGNNNVSGDYLIQGETASVVRGLGLIGRGIDPMQRASAMNSAEEAAAYIRSEEQRRLRQIRQIVLASTNNLPVRVGDIVEGGPLKPGETESTQGVVVSHQTRLGKVGLSQPKSDEHGRLLDAQGNPIWIDEDEVIQGLVLLRKGSESLPALKLVQDKIEAINNTPGRLPPGIRIEPFYDRADLINTTSETVEENLLVGMLLVSVILLMFLSNIRSAIIIALNLPLALLFAFGALYARNESANLLSIGAVDFGIIVDSTVIMVENIYRVLSTGKYANLSLPDRIVRAAHEVERSLLFSTLIMVCALLPLFTMKGAEGQLFRPMAETYAFALAGALLLAVTIAPVLCLLLFKHLKPVRDNRFVGMLKGRYLRQLERVLNHPWISLSAFAVLIGATLLVLPQLGREFIPPLEEGHIWARAMFPVSISLAQTADQARLARAIMRSYPEVETVVCQMGRPESGVDPCGFYGAEFFIPLKSPPDWPAVVERSGPLGRLWGGMRQRTKPELVAAMSAELNDVVRGCNWNFSQVIRDNVLECLSGVQGENSVKIMGPDLDELERLGNEVVKVLSDVPGIKDLGLYRIRGQCNVELPIDRQKCALWNVSVADVHNVIQTAIGGKTVTQMIEGEKSFDITIRWPLRLREDESDILDIPVDVTGHQVTAGSQAATQATPVSGGSIGVSPTGVSASQPSLTGSMRGTAPGEVLTTPRERLRDLVTPLGSSDDDRLDPDGEFVRPGASMITREEGSRLIAVKFGVRERDLAGAVAEAKTKVQPLIPRGYRAQWSGEFQQMEEGERRLMVIVPLSVVLVFVLLYLAFRSLLDAFVVLANVLELSLGGVWALFLTGTNFSIAAAVGFTSIFGVAVMDGLLLVASFNQLRAQGVPLRQAIMQGAERRVRPVMMTALTAIFGLLPAAISTKIGAQSQKPLAIVVVGSMIATLFLTRYLMPLLYSFYGHRDPPADAGDFAHE
jgi:cobalt-zinc-cadmium resistance protein CzcA